MFSRKIFKAMVSFLIRYRGKSYREALKTTAETELFSFPKFKVGMPKFSIVDMGLRVYDSKRSQSRKPFFFRYF